MTNRNVIKFLTAQTISLFGSSLVQYAIIWYITLSTSSGKLLTVATVCGFLPQILISLFAGVWVDRYNRKKLIMLSDGLIAAVTMALALIFMSGYRPIWLLFAVLAARSAGTGIQTPAVPALIAQMAEKKQLMRINGINSTLSSIMMLLSPALSGVILSAAPMEAALWIDVATAVIGMSVTATVKAGKQPASSREPVWRQMKGGFAYLRQDRFVFQLLIFQLLILFLISPSAFLTPLTASRVFGDQVWRLTACEMTYSAGMVAGGLLIASWGGFQKKLRTTLWAGGLYGALMVGMGAAPVFILFLIFNTAIGITSPCYNAPITVTLQERVEPQLQGRVFSFMQIATSCALPLGMVVFGPLADLLPIRWILIGCGLLVVLTVGLMAKKSVIAK